MNQVTKLYRKIGLLDKEEDFCMFKSRYRRKNEQIETLCTLGLSKSHGIYIPNGCKHLKIFLQLFYGNKANSNTTL